MVMNPKNKASAPVTVSGRPQSHAHVPTHQEVADQAHRLWLHKGRPHAQDREIWLEAEKTLKGGSDTSDMGISASDDLGELLGDDGVLTDSLDKRLDTLPGRPPERSSTSL
jgi:hypothetical protein